MKWKSNYVIGVDIIDEQHKHLFDLTEEAESLLELPDRIDKYDEIVAIVQELKDYVVYHFKEEEKLLLQMKYNKYFTHRIYHQDFVSAMEKLDIYEIDNNQKEELLRITNIVEKWLINHVLDADVKWARYYKEYHKE